MLGTISQPEIARLTMKKTLNFTVLFVVIAAVAATIAWNQYYAPEARRSRLARQFAEAMPDSLTDMHRDEAIALLELFWAHSDRDKVDPKDAAEIMQKLEQYVEAGRITATDRENNG